MDLSSNLITPVILCSDAGSEQSCATGAERPKPFQKLSGNLSRFQQTLLRVSDVGQFNPPMIIADQAHHGLVEFEMEMIGVERSAIVLEPACRGTAPSVALAALVAGAFNFGGSLLIMPCDHLVRDPGALSEAIQRGLAGTSTGSLLAFGRKATDADDNSDWIRRGPHLYVEDGDELVDAEVYRLENFLPHSARPDAQTLLATGECYRNSGMYLFPIATVLQELRQHVPDVLTACQQALVSGSSQDNVLVPSDERFAGCPHMSIEQAVMEHTSRGGFVPTKAVWSEESARPQLVEDLSPESADQPEADNVILRDVASSHVQSTGPITVVAGLKDVVVITTGEAVIVSAKSHVGQVLEAHETSDECAKMHAVPAHVLDVLRQAVREDGTRADCESEAGLQEEMQFEDAPNDGSLGEEIETEPAGEGEELGNEPAVSEDAQPELPFEAEPVASDEVDEEPPLLLHAALESAA